MIRHVVLFRARKDVEAGEVAAIMNGLEGLQAALPGMIGFGGGANVSPEGLARGFTYAFTCDFESESARDAYLAHPDHKALGARIVAATEGGIDGLTVVDFVMDAAKT